MSQPEPRLVTPVRRARHLLDPNDLQQSHRQSQSSTEALTHVQRWVMSALAVTTILHLSAGLAIAAYFTDESRLGARIGLTLIAAIIGVLAVVTGRAIHHKKPISIWLLLGLLPGIIGLTLVLR